MITNIPRKQLKGLNRNDIDKYYTKSSVVDWCLHHIKSNINISQDDLIIEPSAGNGSFIAGIKSLTSNHIFYDIEPDCQEVVKQDYLTCDIELFKDKNKYVKTHVIGNPPFGRQSSLAIQFIKQSCRFCHSISFILPKSFKKDSLKKYFPLSFHLIFEIDLLKNSFLVNGMEHDVPCVFQIWEKKSYEREVVPIVEPVNFTFVHKTENPDISFRRVGVNAGKIDNQIEDKSIESHYFIKFNNDKTLNENMQLLSTIVYEFNNTVGPKSISKQELIREFNRLL